MNNVSIVIDNDVFVTSYTENISTAFHIEIDGKAFPNDTWTDFSYPALELWKNELIKHESISNVSFTLYFFDGPFHLEVFKDSHMSLKIDCIDQRGSDTVVFTAKIGYYDFLQQVYTAMKVLSKIIYDNSLHEKGFTSNYNKTLSSITEVKTVLNKK